MSGVPVLLEGVGLRVLVVGAGDVATRKLRAFVDAGARVSVVAPQASEEIRALSEDGRVTWLPRTYVPADIDDADIVVVATDDRAANAMATADARAMHRMANVADAPDDGSFTMMATHRSGSLVVGVSAGGVPAAAARIRDVIARRFDDRYARALDVLVDVRRAALARGDGTRWRTFSRAVLGRDFCRTVEEGTLLERVTPWR